MTLTALEGASCKISGLLTTDAAVALPAASIESFEFTLFDKDTEEVINDREDVSILNENGGSIDSEGSFALELDADDNEIIHAGSTDEVHILSLVWEYHDGELLKTGRHQEELTVTNLRKVPKPA
jgi:hypothetical protein